MANGKATERQKQKQKEKRLSNVLFGQSETLDKYGAEYCDELTGDFGDPYASDASGAVACSESDSELDGLYFWESDG